jgi:transposase
MALEGRFTEHHAMLCRLHRDTIGAYDAAVNGLDRQIAGKAAPWQREMDLLKTIPGFGEVVAHAWIAEIGPAPHQWFSSAREARLLGDARPRQLHERRQAQVRPDRRRRSLHQADAGAGGLVGDQGQELAAGPARTPAS